ncbi:hypothetical protein [Chromohalobacter israelensis]|uniref:hypothetical protein n=1 Tax=Chromohalobacter israelensis TaxID=141390 RepID=UPI00054EE3D5|nr:hypothetical protein [Chromohalobacter israelensis]MDF9433001.1 hypothetical protein [Chromohalobacter israelensis]
MNTPDTIRNPHTGYSRSPNGCSQQVMTQITPDERTRLKGIAELEMRSVSATLRMLMLRGIEQYDTETEHAARD